MKNQKSILFFLFLMLPALAHAHGEEVLYTFFILLASVVIFLIVILAIRISYTGKAVLVGSYLLATAAICGIVNTLPYRENADRINILVGVVPPLSALVAYCLYRLMRKNHKLQKH